MTTLVPITRHVIDSGFFCEAGVKKFAIDFSIDYLSAAISIMGAKEPTGDSWVDLAAQRGR
jgi:hypothetical protein